MCVRPEGSVCVPLGGHAGRVTRTTGCWTKQEDVIHTPVASSRKVLGLCPAPIRSGVGPGRLRWGASRSGLWMTEKGGGVIGEQQISNISAIAQSCFKLVFIDACIHSFVQSAGVHEQA